MRLGLNWITIRDQSDLKEQISLIDDLDIGTIAPPADVRDWSLDECVEYGELIREYGLTIGELGYWENLFGPDKQDREERIEDVRDLLRRADAMQAECVVTLVGSFGNGWAGQAHPDNYGEQAVERARENCRRILDGLELKHTSYVLEPWYNTFFHEPEAVRSFLDDVNDPRLGVHMDAANMHTLPTAYRSSERIAEAFNLLADDVAAVHVKDLVVDEADGQTGVATLREALPGDGTMDYDRYIQEIDGLDSDIPVFTEHWENDDAFVEGIQRVRRYAAENDATVVSRHGTDF